MGTKVCRECGEEKGLNEFYGPYPSMLKHKITKDGYENRCKLCCNIYNKKHQKERGRKQRKKIVALRNSLKQKPCADCGVQYPSYIMQFHHLDPSKKYKELSHIDSVKALMREVEKCIVLCANCHAIRELNAGIPEKDWKF